MRRALLMVLLPLIVACSTRPPRPQPPQPPEPPKDQQCVEGQNCGCWHHPPGNTWLYACCTPNLPGGVLNVAGGPAQCPGTEPTPPPSCPPGQHVEAGSCVPDQTPPPSGNTPAVGTPQGPEKLLRTGDGPTTYVQGKKFEIVMAVPCCMGWGKVPNQRWPLASEGFMDETKKYGFNAYHFRLGPWIGDANNESEWADIGGAYKPGTEAPPRGDGSLQWNDAYWQKVRDLVWHAYQAGSYVEVAIIDTWYIKHCQWGDAETPWAKNVCQSAFDGEMTDTQEKFIRKAVHELGCFGNVIWATGNEEDEVPAGASYYNKMIDIIRSEEKNACNFVHMIGTGSTKGVNSDYQITHSKNALTAPLFGKWTLNNEHNPEKSPEEEASLFSAAREVGQSWAGWRAGANDADWEKRLKLYKDVIGGSAQVGCFAPDPEDPLWGQNVAGSGQMKAAIDAAKAAVGSKCGRAEMPIDPDTGSPKPPATIHEGALHTLADLGEELRKQGYCASGPWVDAIAILAPDGWWEEYHAVAFSDGCYTNNPDVNPKFRWKYTGTNPTPPGPTPPPSGTCANPPAHPISHFNIKEHTKGPNKTIVDSTPIVHDAAYCASIGFTDGRIDCPVRMEGDPSRVACEAEVATPVWVEKPPNAFVSPENSYQLWVPRNNPGKAKVCAQQNPQACGEVQVTP